MQEAVAANLLRIKAVFLSPEKPFTWASGIKSPIYCDNRLILSDPEAREIVEKAIATTVQREFPEAEALMGTSTAGIAHAAIAAWILGKPMGYVRGSAKDHGRNNRIEGRLDPGTKVVVIEDLISTAGSCIEVVEALREAGAEVLGVVSIFTYGMKKGLDRLESANVKNISLSNLDTLLDVAVENEYINRNAKEAVRKFRDNPSDESWISLL
ncbi:MAG: orotate phosphoribosyltransferase [Muribaculaceae bacterium]|nr:orotate phosphoribosyltransferase [Muribaculaceae bacterium]